MATMLNHKKLQLPIAYGPFGATMTEASDISSHLRQAFGKAIFSIKHLIHIARA